MHPSIDHVRRCVELARAPGLVLMLDLDGTLVPFADTPAEAVLDDEGAGLLRALIDADVQVVVVSGRLQGDLAPVMAQVPGARWVAEHGLWRHDGRRWSRAGTVHGELEILADRLEAVAAATLGARLERKTASVCLHWRRVPVADRAELVDLTEKTIDDWLEEAPGFERLAGVEMIEVRTRQQHKGTAVDWIRAESPHARLIAIGDDLTDEDMFRALDAEDVSILVGRPGDRISSAHMSVDDLAGVRRLLGWLRQARESDVASPPPARSLHRDGVPMARTELLVVSNRMPAVSAERLREVGGLVAALEPALRQRSGMWLGWSGQQRDEALALQIDHDSSPARACFELSVRQRRLYYTGFCNRSLWPMLHGLPGRVRYEDDEWGEYVGTNELFARLASGLVTPTATIWIHDYHLLLVAAALRRRGHAGPIGLFLHVPFPAPEILDTMPWSRDLLEGMLAADLVGFHTNASVQNFAASAHRLGASWDGEQLIRATGSTAVAAFPIAIDAAGFRHDPDAPVAQDVEGLRNMLGDRKLLLGVDRLDYSKGILERLEAFERMLERWPAWRGRVTFVQISVPSRAEVPEYAELRARVEHVVGRINGRFGEADWVPVRYLYRSYERRVLAQLYRLADVAVVTPLRDGMNLVAKEFVASQDPARPGVLVLSRFAGAAEELGAAILTNPFHRDGVASDLEHALAMSMEERIDRHARNLAAIEGTSSAAWAARFLDALSATRTEKRAILEAG